MKRIILILFFICLPGNFVSAATYFVSPTGNDSNDGQSQEKAWKTCGKVNTAHFVPGDQILFQRGGQWRESLIASSDGASDHPITFDAYGNGPKPTFLGSDLLDNSKFTPAGDGEFSYPIKTQADSALCDEVFISSHWSDGTLTIKTSSDPRTDHKTYTACLRGNVIFSNTKHHLVFRNLIVDQTAGQLNVGPNQGYGVRIEGSIDVLVESCEAYRCGRHNFAAINSTGFVGRHLKAGYVIPNMPGDNTAYVSYADHCPQDGNCTSLWDDITCNHMENGHGGQNLMFVSHGEKQGLITIQNATVDNNKMSFMSAPVIVKHTTLKGNGTIENFGKNILLDSLLLLDSSTIDQYGSDGIIQNCIATLTPNGGGPTGYSTAIVLRDKAIGNTIRFNTLVTRNFSCIQLAGKNAQLKMYGNILVPDHTAIAKSGTAFDPSDVALLDGNFYSRSATIAGQSVDAIKQAHFELHSKTGDPQLDNQGKPQSGSPCRHSFELDLEIPKTDFDQVQRLAVPTFGASEN